MRNMVWEVEQPAISSILHAHTKQINNRSADKVTVADHSGRAV
jgi:hypothetical protein